MSKTASLVLSSGGARGLAHIGVIEELEKLNYKIKTISGSSIGAIIGGIYATGHLQEFKEWISNLDKLDVFKLMDFTMNPTGFIKGDKVFNEIQSFIPDVNIEDLPIEYKAIATDLINQKTVIFDSGSLFEAIRCSSAIPTIIQPRYLSDKILIDGGVLNPIPINTIEKGKNDLLVVVNLNAKQKEMPVSMQTEEQKIEDNIINTKVEAFKQKWYKLFPQKNTQSKKIGFLDLVNRSFDLMQDTLAENIMNSHTPDVLVNIPRNACGTFDFYKAKQLINMGKEYFKLSFPAKS
ncbi:MAG: phospholipase [Bacteroidia bacterium]|nr:MAG: phospholipase [Bacteroidia bacterium]